MILHTREAFTLLVLLVAVERLFELWLARRNTRRALAAGGREFGAAHYGTMVLLGSTDLLYRLWQPSACWGSVLPCSCATG